MIVIKNVSLSLYSDIFDNIYLDLIPILSPISPLLHHLHWIKPFIFLPHSRIPEKHHHFNITVEFIIRSLFDIYNVRHMTPTHFSWETLPNWLRYMTFVDIMYFYDDLPSSAGGLGNLHFITVCISYDRFTLPVILVIRVILVIISIIISLSSSIIVCSSLQLTSDMSGKWEFGIYSCRNY